MNFIMSEKSELNCKIALVSFLFSMLYEQLHVQQTAVGMKNKIMHCYKVWWMAALDAAYVWLQPWPVPCLWAQKWMESVWLAMSTLV